MTTLFAAAFAGTLFFKVSQFHTIMVLSLLLCLLQHLQVLFASLSFSVLHHHGFVCALVVMHVFFLSTTIRLHLSSVIILRHIFQTMVFETNLKLNFQLVCGCKYQWLTRNLQFEVQLYEQYFCLEICQKKVGNHSIWSQRHLGTLYGLCSFCLTKYV